MPVFGGPMDFEKCKKILLLEHETVAQAAALQKLIEKAVINREWTDFDTHQKTLNGYSTALEIMEKEREALFSGYDVSAAPDSAEMSAAEAYQKAHLADEWAGGDKGRFYTLCLHFTPRQRSELGQIYRSLKLEALKLRLANEAMLEYLKQIRTTLTDFFELAFPDRGGKMYTPRGIPVSHDMRSMVLNKRM